GDLFENQPREIIPWTLVQRNDAAHSGWYGGIEFSGRTRISIKREKDSLKAVFGLNPDPAPFQTRLQAGEMFESPIVLFGGFRDVGDWYPNPQKFPRGLAVIADDAHKHGLKFGIWVDWTQAGLSTQPGALNARDPKVRDWMVTDIPTDWKPEPFKGQTIDIGVPEAKQWAEHEVDRIIT